MLQLKEICKTYRTGSLVQQALDHVSLCLRESEFVAILGPSGSGKTTMLNIIGGLDQYDSGDLVIDGVSTRRYNSRDWDAYRNHTIGFVFQSYNLIPHQTILKNVELALTISGVSRGERTRRAREALEQVGLGEHVHKKPSQLSGGQMQRVAIARALVNDPKILLADEPTGALDSETSLQVMDLLREVAKDRLVVMVTHNPELAQQYATRIVTLKDGEITSDSDPYEAPADQTGAPVHRRLGKASMSFLTALSLSFNNLWTKKARTILVAFAGSIGIIGIAMILSLARGVNNYVDNVEQETLQDYPLTLSASVVDLTSLLEVGQEDQKPREAPADAAVERKMATSMISQVNNNDLASLKAFFEGDEKPLAPLVQAVEYSYGLTPTIYRWEDGDYRQVNPDTSLSAMGFGISSSLLSTSMTRVDSFQRMPTDPAFYRDAYAVRAGRWPEKWNECVVVLTRNNELTDMTLYALGLKDPARLEEMMKAFAAGETVVTQEDEEEKIYPFADMLGREFKLVLPADCYTYNEEYNTWTDRTQDRDYMKDLVQNGETLQIVGIVAPQREMSSPLLRYGINYPPELIDHLIRQAEASPIVRSQRENPDVDVFSGVAFGEDAPQDRKLDLESLITVDNEALKKALDVDPKKLELDLSGLEFPEIDLGSLDLSGLDLGSMDLAVPSLTSEQVGQLLAGVKVKVSSQTLQELFQSLVDGYLTYAAADPSTDFRSLPEAFREYGQSDEARDLLRTEVRRALADSLEALLNAQVLGNTLQDLLEGYEEYLVARGEDTADPGSLMRDYLASAQVQETLSQAAAKLRQTIQEAAISPEDALRISQAMMESYSAFAKEHDLPDLSRLPASFSDYLATPQVQQRLLANVADAVDTSQLQEQAARMLSSYSTVLGSQFSGLIRQVTESLSGTLMGAIQENLSAMAGQLGERMSGLFSFDPQTLAKAFQMNMSGQELSRLVTSLMGNEENTLESNLAALGWADVNVPQQITIYPKNFDCKLQIKEVLADYNRRMEQAGTPEKAVTYNDMVGTLTSSVSEIVNSISMVLIAFVAISLVVSSVMIGVITYISVLERKKEIGILRAIGASKGNISAVFNAETFIIGGLAGLFGIGLTELLLIPTNAVIRSVIEQDAMRAFLPPEAALILIGLSIVLTLLGGLIPSRKAAHSDPVEALRSD